MTARPRGDSLRLVLPGSQSVSVAEGPAISGLSRRRLKRSEWLPATVEKPTDNARAGAIFRVPDKLEKSLRAGV